MVAHVEKLIQSLELPYRILRLCGGDMSFASALTYDFEVFSAAQERWLEVSSVSNFETFQTNRLKIRMKDEQGKTQLLHSLNGSSLALPRILASMLENFQTADGIKIPKSLQPYFGAEKISWSMFKFWHPAVHDFKPKRREHGQNNHAWISCWHLWSIFVVSQQLV